MNDANVRGWLIAIGVGILIFVRVVCMSGDRTSSNSSYRPNFGCQNCDRTGRVECLYCIKGRVPGESYSCAICGGSGIAKCGMCGGSGW